VQSICSLYHETLILLVQQQAGDFIMDKDRVEGSIKQAVGAIKKGAGTVLGDQKLKTEGSIDKSTGKMQNAAGGLKDAVRQAVKE
jgi:uncharacterized protein YjbJ (UPF0337 family)